MHTVVYIINNWDSEWVSIANHLIWEATKLKTHKKERKLWSLAEALLLDMHLHIPNASILRSMLRGWRTSKKTLSFVFQENSILAKAILDQVMTLYQCSSGSNEETVKNLKSLWVNRAIQIVDDLQDKNHRWRRPEDIINMLRLTRRTWESKF